MCVIRELLLCFFIDNGWFYVVDLCEKCVVEERFGSLFMRSFLFWSVDLVFVYFWNFTIEKHLLVVCVPYGCVEIFDLVLEHSLTLKEATAFPLF